MCALDRVGLEQRRHGAEVEVIGSNQASAVLVDRVGTHHRDDAALPTHCHQSMRPLQGRRMEATRGRLPPASRMRA